MSEFQMYATQEEKEKINEIANMCKERKRIADLEQVEKNKSKKKEWEELERQNKLDNELNFKNNSVEIIKNIEQVKKIIIPNLVAEIDEMNKQLSVPREKLSSYRQKLYELECEIRHMCPNHCRNNMESCCKLCGTQFS